MIYWEIPYYITFPAFDARFVTSISKLAGACSGTSNIKCSFHLA
uniref:Uncharacterized protein n=1 Tax=Arundo donax TaxID=35708 RepID=A0A0A9H6W1_ARUDO